MVLTSNPPTPKVVDDLLESVVERTTQEGWLPDAALQIFCKQGTFTHRYPNPSIRLSTAVDEGVVVINYAKAHDPPLWVLLNTVASPYLVMAAVSATQIIARRRKYASGNGFFLFDNDSEDDDSKTYQALMNALRT